MHGRSLVGAGVALLVVAGAAGCRADRPERAAEDAPGAADPPPMTYCDNVEYGFRVAHPADWHTNSGDVLPPCTVFDPEPIEIPVATELPYDLAISITREPVELAELTRDDAWQSVAFTEPTTIDGRRAVRMEIEATGEGLRDAGGLTYRYVVELDAGVLIAATHDVGTLPYEEKRQVLDRMMGTLQMTGPRFAAVRRGAGDAPGR
jgi:hypothetical protein